MLEHIWIGASSVIGHFTAKSQQNGCKSGKKSRVAPTSTTDFYAIRLTYVFVHVCTAWGGN